MIQLMTTINVVLLYQSVQVKEPKEMVYLTNTQLLHRCTCTQESVFVVCTQKHHMC